MKFLNTKKKRWIFKAIGPILFVVVLTRIDLQNALTVLVNAKISYIGFACLVVFPLTLLLRAYKWNSILKINGIRFPLSKAIAIYYIGLSTNIFLPANIGAFSKTYYLAREGHPFWMSLMTTGYDKLFEIMAILVISVSSFFWVFPLLYGKYELIVENITYVCSFALILFLVSFALKKHIFVVLDKAYHYLFSKTRIKISLREYDAFKKSFVDLRLLSAISFLAQSLIIKLTEYFMIYVLSLSLSIPLSFFAVLFCANLFAAFSFLPISFNGVGVRDVTFLFFFPLFGAKGDVGVSLAMLMLFVTLVLQGVGLLGLLKYPFVLKEKGIIDHAR